MSTSGSWFSKPKLSPEAARYGLRVGSEKFAWEEWTKWIVRQADTSDEERAVLLGTMNAVLLYGAVVVRDLGVRPVDACRASYEARTGQPAGARQSVARLVGGFNDSIMREEQERIAAAKSTGADGRANPPTNERGFCSFMSRAEVRASALITLSTRELHGVLSELEGGRAVASERSTIVLGDYFNVIGSTALTWLGYRMGDDLQIPTPGEVE